MINERTVKLFAVKEYHRGKWIEVLAKETGKPKVARISIGHAEMLTGDALAQIKEKGRTTLFGYFEAEKAKVEKPEDVGSNDYVFDVDTAKRHALLKFCKENKIDTKPTDKNVILIEKIKEFQK